MQIPEKDYNNIVGLAKKYALRSFSYIDAKDLIQEGCIAYIKGREKYDKSKNDYYMGFIYKRIVGAMLDYIASQSVRGASTVRNIEPTSQISTTSIDLVQESLCDANEDEILAEVDTERLYKKFVLYLEDMTELERVILVGYFVDRKSMVRLGDELNISRLKIKRIIKACISYIRRKYTYDVATKLNFRELSRV